MKSNAKKKTLRRLAYATAVIALLFGALAYTLSPAGLSRAATLLEGKLSRLLGAQVAIEAPVLRWPLELELSRFAVEEEDRVYLELSDASVRISVRQLLRGHLWVRSVRVENIEYDGWPQRDMHDQKRHDGIALSDPTAWLERITVADLVIERVKLSENVVPQAAEFRVECEMARQKHSTTAELAVTMTALGGETLDELPPALKLEAEFTQAKFKHLRVDGRVDVADAAPLSPFIGTEIEGGAVLHVAIDGPPASPRLEARFESELFRIMRHEAASIRAVLKLEDVTVPTRGSVSAEAVLDDVPLTASADYAWYTPTLAVSGLQAQVLNISVEGDVELDMSTRLVRGELRIETDEIAELAEHFDVAASGRFQALVEMDVEAEMQLLKVDASAKMVWTPYAIVDVIQFNADLRNLPGEPSGDLALRLQNSQTEDLKVDELQLSASGDLQSIELALDCRGELTEPWLLGARALLETADRQPQALNLRDLNLSYGGLQLRLVEPVKLERLEDRYTVDRLVVDIGMGRLTASGYASSDDIMLEADVRDVPLSLFGFVGVPAQARGAMEGRLQASGHPSDPLAALQLRFSDLMPTEGVFWDGPPATFSVAAELESGRLGSRLLLEGLTGTPVEFELDIPLRVSLYPLKIKWPPEGPVSGQLNAKTDLRELADLFVLDMHRLAGLLAVDMKIDGSFESPEVSGYLRVTNGAYEHVLTGTILRDIDVDASGGDDRLVIRHARATDGDRGRLSLSGDLQVLPELDHPFAASLSLENFRLLRHDNARATGNGTAVWEGNLRASELSGGITVSPAELRIPDRLPAELLDMEFVEINGGQVMVDQPQDSIEEAVVRHEVNMNLDVAFPARVFVRGRGLESEWGGGLQIRGNASKPRLSGNLSMLRGNFMFFGKRLTITHGLLTFTGAFPPVPMLDIVAESRSGGITAIMRLSGDLESPEIQLDSVPSMPEDEVLARLLFGRAAARITPWQALTIAQAVNQLRGGGSAFDIMGETRRFLGVDRIEVRSADEHEQQTSVSVGKYVGERVYVELERGVGVEGGRAVVEVELTPTIRLETEMGSDADAGLDVIWSWDY